MTTGNQAPLTLSDVIRTLRPSQWTKNAIVLAAFFFALGDRIQAVTLNHLWPALAAAALFCLVSSGIYILNDIRDIEADRLHPVKSLRPIAAGRIPMTLAWPMFAVLSAAGLAGSWFLSRPFAAVIGGYFAIQILYNLWLKQVALLDIFVIAAGFVLRALGGGVVLGIRISPWLLLCTLLLALFLALCKRRHEKRLLEDAANEHRPSLQAYDTQLLDQLIAIVSAAAIASYSIYTFWPDTVTRFGSHALGFTIPFVLFGVFRYLDLVYRHDKGGRPEKVLLTDLPLLVDLALYGATVLCVFFVGRL